MQIARGLSSLGFCIKYSSSARGSVALGMFCDSYSSQWISIMLPGRDLVQPSCLEGFSMKPVPKLETTVPAGLTAEIFDP